MNLSFIAQPQCYLCPQKSLKGELLCTTCLEKIGQLRNPRTLQTFDQDLMAFPNNKRQLALFSYSGKATELILKIKNSPRMQVPNEFSTFIDRLLEEFFPHFWNRSFDYIVPVPTHPKRQLIGNTDLPSILAERLSLHTHKPCLALLSPRHSLRAWLSTPQKNKKPWEKCRIQAQDRFKLNSASKSLSSTRALLVDDVCTSGATLRGAADMLKAQKIRVPCSWVFASARKLF